MTADDPTGAGHPSVPPPAAPGMPLLLASAGQEVELAAVRGGRQLQHRLAEMGLTPGVRLRVVTKGSPGPLIVSVKGVRMVLGQGMAARIHVRPA